MERILIIGNSHSVDAFQLLPLAFQDQMPEDKVTLGILYYSGCSITQHINFGKNGEKVCHYYKNNGGFWNIEKKVNMERVVSDEPWEKVFFQAAKSDLDDTLNRPGRREIESMVDAWDPAPHRFYWHTSWPSPNDPYFFPPNKKVPEGYQERLIRLYGHDPLKQFTVLTNKAKVHILDDKVYEKAICTGAGIMNAHVTQGRPQTEIWRDYTHLNDFGRLIAAFSFFVQLAGKKLEKIGVDVVPVEFRHMKFQEEGELYITEEMKETIITAANHALDDPWTVPGI
ncbi:MAG: DUF4886 domain-containing protein [Clostridia bacterium]|nr:DUF4886 domain-containing protein [Clostridia bacterium]